MRFSTGMKYMDLFRKTALQKMLSPDQLDQLIRITQPRDWLALIAILSILLALIFWSIWGVISTEISGRGIILRQGGIHTVFMGNTGTIVGIDHFKHGDIIQKGQVIATIQNPLLVSHIQLQKDFLTRLLTMQKSLKNNTQKNFLDLQIAKAQFNLQLLQSRLAIVSTVISDYFGVVVHVKASDGDYLTPGSPILSVESTHKVLQVLLLISPSINIDLVQPGMAVKVFPGSKKVAGTGYLIGHVTEVSKFPITTAEINAILHDPEMLSQLEPEKGLRYLVTVALTLDPSTVSGYQWSSSLGRKIPIASGALCTATITIQQQAPINFVFPHQAS